MLGSYKHAVFFSAVLGVLFGISSLSFSLWQGGAQDLTASFLHADKIIEERFNVISHIVQEGDTWSVVSENMGIGGRDAARFFDSSHDVYDLASVRAGNEFRFFFGKENKVLGRVEYDIDGNTYLLMVRNAQGIIRASIKDIQYDVEEVTAHGTIENSLFETAQAQGLSHNVILNMAHILSWDVDFASSVQAGDSFAVLYEKRRRNGREAKTGKILAARFTNKGEDFYAFRYQNPEGTADHYSEEGRELRRQFLKSPLDYSRITSGFSYNRFHPILQTFTTHRAIDYGAAVGTPVSATGDGVIAYAGWNGGYGRYVQIRHGGGYATAYAHLSAIAKDIYVGARVSQNDVVGFVGSTGLSTGPHLHYEMILNGIKINPLGVDLPPGEIMEGEYLEDFYKTRDKLKDRLNQN